MHLIVKQIVILGAISMTIALGDGMIRGMELPPKPDGIFDQTPPTNGTITAPNEPVVEKVSVPANGITPAVFKAALDDGRSFAIDARSRDEFEEGHIPMAFHLELSDFNDGIPEIIDLLMGMQQGQPDLSFIVYCGGGECHASEAVASEMKRYELNKVFVFEPGIPGWIDAGYEIETGAGMW